MEVVLAITLFSFWFLLWAVYIFQRPWLGKLAGSLSRMGWLSDWSMFVQTQGFAGKQMTILYRDQHGEVEVSDWKEIQHIKWHPLFIIINPAVGIRSVMVACFRQLIQEHLAGNKHLNQLEVFHFLCNTVCQMQPKKGADSRQIRLVYSQANDSNQVVIDSHFIRLA